MIEKRIASILLAACLLGCERSPNSGTEIPNELVGREVIAGKGPAADAEIRLIPIGYMPGGPNDESAMLTYRAHTDAAGRFAIPDVRPGQYNILAMQDGLKSIRDSVPITEIGIDLGSDTLKLPGTLLGTVALQPNHSARTVTVQVLGTNLFVNVDQDGGFALQNLAPGQYRLRVETSLDGYTVLYVPVEVRSGRIDTLPPLVPFYALMPVVTGLRAESSTDGCIRLSWDATSYPNSDGYLVYRDSAGPILPKSTLIAWVQKPRYVDTLFSWTPRAGQFSFEDSSIREFTYRVRLLDAGGQIGPANAKASAFAYSSEKVTVSGKWRLAIDSAAFGARGNPAVVEFGGRLWIIGGIRADGTYYHDVWSSADGIAWTRDLDSLPIAYDGVFRAAVMDSTLWILALEDGPAGPVPVCYSSSDGRHWARVGGPEGPAPQSGMDFVSFEGRLWIIGGVPYGGILTSTDGESWIRQIIPDTLKLGIDPGTVIHPYGLWIVGGGEPTDSLYSRRIWLSPDGHNWIFNSDNDGLLPRSGQRLVGAGNELYSIGGISVHNLAEGGVEVHDLTDQVWTSPNGNNWELFDSHAPFGKRYYPAVAWFQGKVWCIGGLSAPTGSPLADIWMMTP